MPEASLSATWDTMEIYHSGLSVVSNMVGRLHLPKLWICHIVGSETILFVSCFSD